MKRIKDFFRPAYRAWMAFAEVIGYVMSRVILTLMYLVIFLPVSAIMFVVRYDPLGKRFLPKATTYWVPREAKPFDPKRCERQF